MHFEKCFLFAWLQGFGMIGGPLGYLRSSNHPWIIPKPFQNTSQGNREFWYVVFGALSFEGVFVVSFWRQLMAFCQLSHQGSTWDRYILLDLWRTQAKVAKRSTGPNDSSHILPMCNFFGGHNLRNKKARFETWNTSTNSLYQHLLFSPSETMSASLKVTPSAAYIEALLIQGFLPGERKDMKLSRRHVLQSS